MPRSTVRAIVLTALLAGCAGTTAAGGGSTPTPAAPAAPPRPDVTITIEGGLGDGTYRSDPASTSSHCVHSADGSWRLIYAGGNPWFSMDLLVGPHAAESGGSDDLALEVTAGNGVQGFLWMDPSHLRGGDTEGRSKVTIEVKPATAGTTFVVTGTTLNDKWHGDDSILHVEMTATCPLV